MRLVPALLLLLLIAAPAAAQRADEQAKLAWAGERGALLFEIDRAAWVTTDDMRERLHGRRDVPIRGWVVERDGDAPHAYLVTYFGDGPAGPVAWYAGRVRDNKVVSGELFAESARPPLTPVQRRIADATTLARAQTGLAPCTPAPFNTAVVPPERPDAPLDVYLLTAMTQDGVYPLGGHFLVRVGADGKVLSTRAFMKTCLNLGPVEKKKKKKGKPAFLGVSHLLDSVPTEIHVFISHLARLPVVVLMPDPPRMWFVDGSRIMEVKQ